MALPVFKTFYPWKQWLAQCNKRRTHWVELKAGTGYTCTQRSFISRVVHFCKDNGCDYEYCFPDKKTIQFRIFNTNGKSNA